ncbi:MAG: hypothetical protein M1820_006438 [Bogoriella megaspora]|nr:MAG: hypothetical protein M1820_006438 [Bogoriella megaspora]
MESTSIDEPDVQIEYTLSTDGHTTPDTASNPELNSGSRAMPKKMAPNSVLGKRRRKLKEKVSHNGSNNSITGNIRGGTHQTPHFTSDIATANFTFDSSSNTSHSTPSNFVLAGKTANNQNDISDDVSGYHNIKTDLQSPKSVSNDSPFEFSPNMRENTISESRQDVDRVKKRGPKRQLEKQPRPNTSIPQALSWAEYAKQCSIGAYSSRLNPFALSAAEDKLLRNHIDPVQVTTYLNIRNGILRLWTRNPMVSVTKEEAFGCAKQVRHFGLAQVAYDYLVRNGYINFGCVEVPYTFDSMPRAKSKRRQQIVVIGAGMSGLGCARQLEGLFAQFGQHWTAQGEYPPNVIVLEARQRLGGRVYSHPLRTQVRGSLPGDLRNTAELGAHIITGFESGNPLNAIVRGQLALHYHALKDNSLLYDCDGSAVNKDRDDSTQNLYNDILERVCVYRYKASPPKTLEGDYELMLIGKDPTINNRSDEMDEFDDKKSDPIADAAKVASHGQMVQRDKTAQHVPSGFEKLAGKAYQVTGLGAKSTASGAAKAMGWMAKEGISTDRSLELDAFVKNSAHPTLGATMDEAIKQYQNIINLTPQDLRLLNWHHANLEYSNATHVNDLSLSGWDQDTGNEFEGEHCQVKGGYIQVPKGLYQLPYPLDVRFGTEVSSISYDWNDQPNNTAKIACSTGEFFDADHVVLTSPLGVLKERTLKFHPPLPEWKTGAIERLGFGLLNKVVLVYDQAFWDEDRDMFGLLNQASREDSLEQVDYSTGRGRFYFFWNCLKTSGRPVLVSLMAGDAAHQTEIADTSDLIREVTGRLAKICAPKSVPNPEEVIVTRWRKDQWARGTYSYVGPKSLPGDYDVMAKRVGNLHFAGEATCGTHPATVHGAYLSGLRAASDVAEALLGPISVPQPLIPPAPIRTDSTNGMSIAKPKAKAAAALSETPNQPGAAERADYEATILDAIFSQIGARPLQPLKEGINPFLLYTKEKWAECKAACDEKKKKTSRSAEAKAGKDEIRVALGKMWRLATEEEKKPFKERADARKQMTTAWMAEWKRNAEEWDRKAAEIREQFTDSKPQFGDQGAQLRARLDAATSNGVSQNGTH